MKMKLVYLFTLATLFYSLTGEATYYSPMLRVDGTKGTQKAEASGDTVQNLGDHTFSGDVELPAGVVDDGDINFSAGGVSPSSGQVSAADMPIEDAGGYYGIKQVEAALQAIGALPTFTWTQASDITTVDTDGHWGTDNVDFALDKNADDITVNEGDIDALETATQHITADADSTTISDTLTVGDLVCTGTVTSTGSPLLDLTGSDPSITTDTDEPLLINTTGRVVHVFSDLTSPSTSSGTYEALATLTIPNKLLAAGTSIDIKVLFKKTGDAATGSYKIHGEDGTNTFVIAERAGLAANLDSVGMDKFCIVQDDGTTLAGSPSSFETFADYSVNSSSNTGAYLTVDTTADWDIIISALSTGGAEAISLEVCYIQVIRP